MPFGYLFGSFDLLNVRHLDAINAVRDASELVAVGVYDDDTVTALYGRPPVIPLLERVHLLEHVRGVHDVLVHGQDEVTGASWFAIADEPVPHGTLVTWIPVGRRTRAHDVVRATSTLVA